MTRLVETASLAPARAAAMSFSTSSTPRFAVPEASLTVLPPFSQFDSTPHAGKEHERDWPSQFRDGRDAPPNKEVFILAMVCVPSLPPQENSTKTWGNPPARRVRPVE